MTNEAKQLLKDKPELCKEIATSFAASLVGQGLNYEKWVEDHKPIISKSELWEALNEGKTGDIKPSIKQSLLNLLNK